VKETKENNGAKFENLIAINLLKHVYAKRDYEGKNYKLHYLRNKDKREVDFLLANENFPEQIIEVKYTDDSLSSNLKFFSKEYNLNATQVVFNPRNPRKVDGIPIVNAMQFLTSLVM
jgi:predicted AAA+ superfamily ATPase